MNKLTFRLLWELKYLQDRWPAQYYLFQFCVHNSFSDIPVIKSCSPSLNYRNYFVTFHNPVTELNLVDFHIVGLC